MSHSQDSNPDQPMGIDTAPDFKVLYRNLESALAEIERTDNVAETLELLLDALVTRSGKELGLKGGRVYKREEEDYLLCCSFGTTGDAPVGVRLPPDYPPHLKTLEDGLLIMHPGEPGYDEIFERSVGVEATFAAIAAGKGNRFVIGFSIDGDVQEERLVYSLSAVRHVINLKLEQQEFTGMLEQARAIQESMLPDSCPCFPGYDLAGRARPAERVGGDLFDYLRVSSDVLGVAIADASGHGVPAALMARDVITGLRTLAGEDAEIGETVQRLNRVIHQAALSSKFVSLFYGRFSTDGDLAYCNAGHNSPLLMRSGSCSELTPGGPVLGPIPGARYEHGNEHLETGDTVVMFTDGVVERENHSGEPFGTDRLRRLLDAGYEKSAERLVEQICASVDSHARELPPSDDMTVVVIRKT